MEVPKRIIGSILDTGKLQHNEDILQIETTIYHRPVIIIKSNCTAKCKV